MKSVKERIAIGLLGALHVRQVVAKEDFAVLVRGEDKFGHFRHVPSPTRDMDDDATAWHRRILSTQNEAIYQGTKQPVFTRPEMPTNTRDM